MRILLVTPHFYPETFKCNDMAFELQRRGHDVTVMTPIPDYPKGSYFDGYGIFKRRRETINGVKIHRSLIIPRGNGSSIRLALNYISYTCFATLKAIWFGISKKYDAIIVHETSPILVGIPAVIIKKLQNIPLFFWVLDLWPESLTAAGGISNKHILSFFKKITNWIYKNSNRILISSKGFRNSINQKGDYQNNIVYFPNWIDNIHPSVQNIPTFTHGFNVVFTGNIGDAQDFPHILKAAELLNGKKINFIIVGDGRMRPWLEKSIQEKGLTNIILLGRYPVETMPLFYKQADILFLALKDSPIFSLTVPAKLQAYMSSGKPIVAMINGEGAELIREADCGWSVPAEDSESLANLLYNLSSLDKDELLSKGENGKKYSTKHYDFTKCMDHLCQIISS